VTIKALIVLDHLGREFQMVADADRKVELKTSMEHLRATLLERKGAHLERLADEGAREDMDRAFTLIHRSCGLTDNQKHTLERPLIKRDSDIVKRNERATTTAVIEEPDVILTTEAGLRRRQDELRHLLEVEIPENSRDIGRAAAMGDLSENAEWAAAIERQGFLTKKAAEVEESLRKVEVLDLRDTDTSCVAFGTRVALKNRETQATETYSVLGPWDLDEDGKIISYLAPMARAMTGATPGQVVEVVLPEGKRRYEILTIDRIHIAE
jgi:transcription elongation GreA/GreB family factor